MSILLLVFLLVLNFAISWFNAWSVGRSWADSKVVGGWPRFVVWSAAVMSACGFTWCYLAVLGLIAGWAGWLTPRYVQLTFEIGYVVIIFPVLGSGLAIWMDSLTTAWRQRDLASISTAAYNTFAQIHNTYDAISTLPDIFSDISNAFSGDDDDDSKGVVIMIVVLLVALALAGGVLTTIMIVRNTASSYASDVLVDIQSKGRNRRFAEA